MERKFNERDCLESTLMRALVYGWYGRGAKNIGDLLFCKAFKSFFSKIEFTFTDNFKLEEIEAADIIIFGGGSFLYAPINGKEHLDKIVKKKIFYMGVGIETNIHPIHQQLMKLALIIAHRNIGESSKLIGVTNAEIIEIPDLVYCLSSNIKLAESTDKIANSILILPNAELLPKWNDINWKHTSWNYFKSEFSQFLDELKDRKNIINFAPFCSIPSKHDLGAAVEIINQMHNRDFRDQLYDLPSNFEELTYILSKYELIITQRYHGAILAHMCQRPCISIAHHDKLKNINDSCISSSYYELSKQKLHDMVLISKNTPILPIKLNKFEALRERIYTLIGA